MGRVLRFVLLCRRSLALAGCGGTAEVDRPNEEASLLLDFTPNGVHTGIYLAQAREYDRAEGVALEVRAPGASTDALRQLQGGRADMAILDIHDLGLARQEGADIVGVMALVQRPLASVLAAPDVRRPRDLEGRRAGVTGLPSDVAVLRSVVEGDGGDPDAVKTTTIGFEAVKALLADRVAGATAFWNVEGVALRGAAARTDAASSGSTTTARRRTPSSSSASPARRSRSAARWWRQRSARSSVATSRSRPTPRAASRAARRRGRPRPRGRPGPTRRCRPRVHRRRPRLRRAARGRPARMGRMGRGVRHPRAGARRPPRLRLHARRARLEPVSPFSRQADPDVHGSSRTLAPSPSRER